MSEAESLQLERTPYHAEEGFCGFDRYLVGAWKRTLQWREFGGSFAHLRTSNTIVVIDEHISKDAQTQFPLDRACAHGVQLSEMELRTLSRSHAAAVWIRDEDLRDGRGRR
eukprot:TRINITY_DN10171_c0_g1_i1.p1 TRINITY_DN10171_c0_g1~~TRINITY_DN10171_c0_g1_i1.p1  ORF type:complete len:111 (+),score=18.10 TRINITY_DN10171_c0_g1_i1:111-443(+)